MSVGARTRVLIADDHAPTRGDLREVLEEDGRFEVCAEAADAPAAVAAAVREQPDLCLLDIRMPGRGVAAAWEISARMPETKVVMLTVSICVTAIIIILGKAFARRIEGRSGGSDERIVELERRINDLEARDGQVAELEDRPEEEDLKRH